MTGGCEVRRFEAHEWSVYRSLRLRALADSPDAFGSTLAVEQAFGDEQWFKRLQGKPGGLDYPALAESGGEPVGLAWGRIDMSDPHEARLYQMWVAPDARSRGVGRMLLDSIIRWAVASGAHYIKLDLTEGNVSALRLYESVGFVPHGVPKPLRPGSALLSRPMRLLLGEGDREDEG